MTDKLLATIPEAAEALNLGRSTIYELISSGQIKIVKVGRAVRIPMADLHAFVERRIETAS